MSKPEEKKNPFSISHERYEQIMKKDPTINLYGPLKFYPVNEITKALEKIMERYNIGKIDVWFNSVHPFQLNGSTYKPKEKTKSEL